MEELHEASRAPTGIPFNLWDQQGRKNQTYGSVVKHVTLNGDSHHYVDHKELRGLGIANLRFHFTNPKQRAIIEIGPVSHSVFAELEHTFSLTDNGSFIPVLDNHRVGFVLYPGDGTTNDVTVEYDVVTLPPNYDHGESVYTPIFTKGTQTFQHTQELINGQPVTKLVAVFDTPVESASITCVVGERTWTFPLEKVADNTFQIAFQPTVNFSGLNKATLSVEPHDVYTTGRIYVYYREIIRFMDGMAGDAFGWNKYHLET